MSDREWILDGAAVHISMVGFDDGSEKERTSTAVLFPPSTPTSQLLPPTHASRASPGEPWAVLMGDTKGGPFDIRNPSPAKCSCPQPAPETEQRRPATVGQRARCHPDAAAHVDHRFPPGMEEDEAMFYEQPYEYIRRHVRPKRADNKRAVYRERWWIHAEARPKCASPSPSATGFIATTTVSKHRVFVWLPPETLPDHQLIVFARDDDWFFGVLHSRFHQIWALCLGTQLREKESGFRYNANDVFRDVPFPWPPATPLGKLTRAQDDQRTAIAQAAAR